MSSPQTDLSEQQPPPMRYRMQPDYQFNEEELNVMRQCNSESFWYRSLPFAITASLITQALIKKGMLSTSPKFGAVPKIAFACLTGYTAGKISYIKECRKKIMQLQNSPLAEQMRQDAGLRQPFTQRTAQPPQFSDADVRAPIQAITPVAAEPTSRVYSSKYESSPAEVPFSSSMSESSTTGIEDCVLVEPDPIPEAAAKQKPVTYEELRAQNRGFLHPAGLAPSRVPVQERKPWKEGVTEKKNKYGDVWEE